MATLKVVHVSGDGVAPDRHRRWMAAITADDEGVVDGGDFLVSEKASTPDMSVDVAVGRGIVKGTESAATQGSYFVETDAVTNLVVGDGDASNDRIDVIVAQVRDSDYSGADDDWRLFLVVGTPAGSPTAPTIPANSIKLGEILVVALESTSIVDSDITDFRVVWNPHYFLEVFTGSGTWTKADYPWAKSLRIRVVGHGGGGGGAEVTSSAQMSAGGGGGAGGYSEARIPIASAGATETVTVGTGGGGGSGAANGSAGGVSSFGSHASATGGAGAGFIGVSGGSGHSGEPGAGGVGSLGDVNVDGGGGTTGTKSSNSAATGQWGGAGGSGPLGGGGESRMGNQAADAGGKYGGGGGGAANWQDLGNKTGGAGGDGLVLVEMFG